MSILDMLTGKATDQRKGQGIGKTMAQMMRDVGKMKSLASTLGFGDKLPDLSDREKQLIALGWVAGSYSVLENQCASQEGGLDGLAQALVFAAANGPLSLYYSIRNDVVIGLLDSQAMRDYVDGTPYGRCVDTIFSGEKALREAAIAARLGDKDGDSGDDENTDDLLDELLSVVKKGKKGKK